MRLLLTLPLLLLLPGCAALSNLGGLGFGGMAGGGQADVLCNLDGEAVLIQNVGVIASTQRLARADRLCAAMKPAPAASAVR